MVRRYVIRRSRYDFAYVPSAPRVSEGVWSARTAKVLALVDSSLIHAITEATSDQCLVEHVSTVCAAQSALKERKVSALLVSPSRVQHEQRSKLTALVNSSPLLVTAAVIDAQEAQSYQSLLELGQCGVRVAIDLSERSGWTRLRDLLSASNDATKERILEAVSRELVSASPTFRQFVLDTVRYAPHIVSVRELATTLRVHPSTLMSRFFRAGLPAPKKYLAHARLLYASHIPPGASASAGAVRRFSRRHPACLEIDPDPVVLFRRNGWNSRPRVRAFRVFHPFGRYGHVGPDNLFELGIEYVASVLLAAIWEPVLSRRDAVCAEQLGDFVRRDWTAVTEIVSPRACCKWLVAQ